MPTAVVVGSGAAGLAAAHALAKDGYVVTVLEAAEHVGGHAHTMEVDGVPVDVGFMVFNRVTYPNMVRPGRPHHHEPAAPHRGHGRGAPGRSWTGLRSWEWRQRAAT